MKRMLQKALLGMMLLSLLITGIPVPSLAEEALVTEALVTEAPVTEAPVTEAPIAEAPVTEAPITEAPITEAPLAEMIVEETETVVPAAEPAEAAAEVPVQTAEAEEEIQVPEGFDAAVLQAARASSACQHKNLTVYSYGDTTVEKLDERFHVYTSTFTGRSLACCDCGTVLQTIDWNRTEQGKNLHTWYNFESKEKNHMYCEDCGATKVIKYPCGHKLLTFAEDGLYHCGKCDAIWNPWTDSYEINEEEQCAHRHIKILYPNEVRSYHIEWDANTHVRVDEKIIYDDEPVQLYDAECEDCGVSMNIDLKGNISSVGKTSYNSYYESIDSMLEPHTLVGGVCGECGYTVEPPVYQPAPKPNKITLSPAGTAYVNLGDTLNLDVISDPENAEFSLTWKTSNGRVATVENGQVRGVSEGSVRITATTNNGKSASVTVKVVDPYKPTKVTLDKTGTVQLNLGETLTLTPSLTPATAQADYTWKSSSAKIATVSGGVVTPVGEGTATITVTAVRGKVKKTAKVKVKVVDPYKPTKVTLDRTGTVQLNLGETLKLTPSLTPATAQADYTWKTSSAKVATVSGGVVTPVGEGTATITVTAVRGKVKKTAKVKIKVVDPMKPTRVSLNETGTCWLPLGNTLQLYPRTAPVDLDSTKGEVTYNWKSSSAKVATVDQNGIVYPVGKGTATITVTATRGKVKKTASVKVKVVAPDVADTLIFMQNGTALTSLKLGLGQMAFIGVSVRPYTASNVQISYTSSKPQTASVETSPSGEVVVMGLNPGTTTITATDTISGKKTTLKVTVTK